MNHYFLNEAVCYEILKRYGIKTPDYFFCSSGVLPVSHPFKTGDPVVLKAVVDGVWHKSDLGLIEFTSFSESNVKRTYGVFKERNPRKENWRGMLVCEKVSPASAPLPMEILLSIKDDLSCGPVVTLGFGGIHTELWGKELKDGVLNFPTEIIGAQAATQQFSRHLLGKILLGKTRQGAAYVTPRNLERLFGTVWALASCFRKEGIALLEINPLIVDNTSAFIVLDAVGEKQDPPLRPQAPATNWASLSPRALFNPKTFVIAGVSSKKKAFGNLILENFKAANIPGENIRVLKPNCTTFEGYAAFASLAELTAPVDALILAIPARPAIELIEQACRLSAARLIYLVSGGIGDSADHEGFKEQLNAILSAFPIDQRPRIIGPNSLGIILSPQRVNTLFIPSEKLPVRFYPDGTIGLIAQSGAFFITRISRNPSLPVRFGFCIGNQLDVSATEILQAMADDPSLKVIGLYLEGPPHGDALSLARAIQKASKLKKVIVYRGGRSRAGMRAAAGHTGALASEYGIEKTLLQQAGTRVCESFTLFENSLVWYSAYPAFRPSVKADISVMTNAGYESVAGADGLGERLAPFSEEAERQLSEILARFKLTTIVSPANPLDLTPMASDDVYFECARAILSQKETMLLIIGIVPLTAMINTHETAVVTEHVKRLKTLITEHQKAVAVVVDSGALYQKFKYVFLDAHIPLFASMQDVFEVIM